MATTNAPYPDPTNRQPERDPSFQEALSAARIDAQNAPPLYHYTTADGLNGIVSRRVLWATHASFFNDMTEWGHGVKAAQPAIRKLEAAGYHEAAADLLQELREPSLDYYAVCFCTDGDLLSQWQGYGSSGSGYAVEFDPRRLSLISRTVLLNVDYDGASQRARYDGVAEWAIERLQRASNSASIRKALKATFSLLTISSKCDVFKTECEWRLVCWVKRQRPDPGQREVKFRSGKGMLIPYVEVSLDQPLPVCSVRCGPTLRPDGANRLAVRMLLDRYGLDERAALVKDSRAPLRA